MSDRLVGIAFLPYLREHATYRGSGDDATIRRGPDEALVYTDMLAMVKPSPLRRMAAWVKAVARVPRVRDAPRGHPEPADFANVTTMH
jgi:hypothetical protein